MGYDKGNKATSQIDPVIPNEKKVRQYGREVDRLLGVINSHKDNLESLQSEESSIKGILEESYDKHKVEVANLYNALGEKQKAFLSKCAKCESEIAEKQARVDEQATELETTAISIANDTKHLIEKENELIHLSNETIGRDQANANKEEYLESVSRSVADQKEQVKKLQIDLQLNIDKQAKLIGEKEMLSRDLDIKIKQHDARVNEVNSQIRDLKRVIAEYKQVQADAFIATEKVEQFEKEAAENRKYSAQLKETDAVVTNREHQITVREKANKILSRDLQIRLKSVQQLEAKYGGSSHG